MGQPHRPDFPAALGAPPDELAQKAAKALAQFDLDTLWPLVRPHLPDGGRNATTAKNTLSGIRRLIEFARGEGETLGAPRADLAARYLARLAHHRPAYQRAQLSRARALYHALRTLGAVDAALDPFAGVRGPDLDARPGVDRSLYREEEIERLLAHADQEGQLLILLGANAGLTTREVAYLTWEDVRLLEGALEVRGRAVVKSERLEHALRTQAARAGGVFAQGPVFSLSGVHAVRARLYELCREANVTYRAWRALRHAYALRLWQATHDLKLVADQLGVGSYQAVVSYRRLAESR